MMPKHFLIVYVPLKGHKDPDFKEFSYGDSDSRGKSLKNKIFVGSYIFLHTTIGSNRYITSYFVIDKIISGEEALADPSINSDGQFDDWLFIGDENKSRILKNPILFNKKLSENLSLKIDFNNYYSGKISELSVISSATRHPREITDSDVNFLLNEIEKQEGNTKFENPDDVKYHLLFYDEGGDIIPIDEVHKIKENEIMKLIIKNPSIIEKEAKIIDYESQLPDGDRLDLLLAGNDGSIIVAEVKGPNKLTDDISTQVASYARDIEKEFPENNVRKMIICDGNISSKLKKACESLGIEIVVYGVKLDCFKVD